MKVEVQNEKLVKALKKKTVDKEYAFAHKVIKPSSTVGKIIYPVSPDTFEIMLFENLISKIVLPEKLHKYSDKELAKLFHIDIRYVEEDDLPSNLQAIIKPTEQKEYNAVIVARHNEKIRRTSLFPELATYLLNMCGDGKLRTTHKRFKKETITSETLRRDSMMRAMLLPLDNIKKEIANFDRAKHPDAIRYLARLSKTYNIEESHIVKRFQEVRSMFNVGAFFKYSDTVKRIDFLETSKEIKTTFFTRGNGQN